MLLFFIETIKTLIWFMGRNINMGLRKRMNWSCGVTDSSYQSISQNLNIDLTYIKDNNIFRVEFNDWDS